MGLSVIPGLECFLSQFRKNFNYYTFKYFLRPFLSFSFWYHDNVNVMVNIVPEVSETVLISNFFLHSVSQHWFHHSLSAHLFIPMPHLFCYWFLLVYFFHFSCIIHLCFLSLKSSCFLLNIPWIFSICASIIFLRLQIIFNIVTLLFQVDVVVLLEEVSCYFFWYIFLYCLICLT